MKLAGWKIGIMTLLLATTVACGNNVNKPEQVTGNTATEQPSPAATEAPVSDSKIEVDETKAAELIAQFNNQVPSSTVTISVAIAELLNELGIETAGVPTTKNKLPEAFVNLPRIGSSHQPDLEQIAKLQPGVILGPSSIKDSLDKSFKPANLPTAYLPADSLDELKLSTVVLGRVYGKEDKANEVLQKLSEQEAEAVKLSEGKDAPSVMVLFGSAESLMFMNDSTFVGSLAKKLGAKNVLSEVLKKEDAYVPLDMESIVTANPDIILLVAHGDPSAVTKQLEDDVKKNGAWEKLNAFKNGKLIALDYSLYGVASLVNAPNAYQDMAKILYN
ncbi:ferrichrome ABC transporter substrate-binding protein [Paenibacillus sp. FSL A5-0031]|uniref:ABC transporter substrate-binding protein n=1 Tax=Paenibacillus sp. FSL A5-0031 TaxID=1920420 RepID=UPI00096DFAAF|nr:ABC transporter substrate-binding protein [Paenibacillus sp. FSL A5-0031]OME84144.1 ferrichrome ABC transporter substrate-binding protein [Paenibacillus sp. FSL A5-0031]